MDQEVRNSGYGIPSSNHDGRPPESSGRRYETGIHKGNKRHADSNNTNHPGRFACHPCSARAPEPPKVAGCTNASPAIGRGSPASHSSNPLESMTISIRPTAPRLTSPVSRSTAADLSADSLKPVAQVCCNLLNRGMIADIQLKQPLTEQQVLDALSNLKWQTTVMPYLRELSSAKNLSSLHECALRQVAKTLGLLKSEQTPDCATNSRAKVPELATGSRPLHNSLSGYVQPHNTTQLLFRPVQPGHPHRPVTTPLNIESPEPVGTEPPGTETHRKMLVPRADLSAPLPNQSDTTESANRESSRPPIADADPYLGVKGGDLTQTLKWDIENQAALSARLSGQREKTKSANTGHAHPPTADADLYLGVKDEDLTASLVRDIRGGVPNRANFFRNSAVLPHDVATGASTACSQPPIGQEIGIIPPTERFLPIRSGANIAGAVTAGLNPKTPVQGGARRKHLPPGVGRASVAPAQSVAALTKASDRPGQRVTAGSQNAHSKHLGFVNKAQLQRIFRNLKQKAAMDTETCKKIVVRINSLGLDKDTIAQAAGDCSGAETHKALAKVIEQYTEQNLVPSPATRQVPVSVEGLANADRPENPISGSNDSEPLAQAAGHRQFIHTPPMGSDELPAGQSTTGFSEEVPGHVGWLGRIKAAMVGAVSPFVPHESEYSSWEQGVCDLLGVDTPSLRSDIKKQRMDPSALDNSPGLVRITEAHISSIIGHLEYYFPNMDTHAKDMIRRHIGAIPLTTKQIEAACLGGRYSLDKILQQCLELDSKLSDKANTGRQFDVESPVGPRAAAGSSSNFHHLPGSRKHIKDGFVAGPGPSGVLPGVRAAAVQAGRGINDPRQAVVMTAGIQARNNNCCLASFFMAIANDGVLGELINDAVKKIETLERSGGSDKAQSLEELVYLLKKFNIGDNVHDYIPNDELDKIRLRYGLRAVKLKDDVVDNAFDKTGQMVTFKVESEFKDAAAFGDAKDAKISLQISSGSQRDSLHATVKVLPDASLGSMRLKGKPLNINQQLTQADLAELTFVPLGEQLEPTEFIHQILNDIYGYLNTEAVQLQSSSRLDHAPMPLNRKWSWLRCRVIV